MANGLTAEEVAAAMQMRAMTIQFLKALEDRLIAAGELSPEDRACLTRQERRAREVDPRPLSGV